MTDSPTDPDALRAEIEQTRSELADTVEQLAAKTDVSARASDAAGHAVEVAKDFAKDTVEAAVRGPVPRAAIIAGAAVVGVVFYLVRRRRS